MQQNNYLIIGYENHTYYSTHYLISGLLRREISRNKHMVNYGTLQHSPLNAYKYLQYHNAHQWNTTNITLVNVERQWVIVEYKT